MTEHRLQLEGVKTKVLAILPGLNILDVMIVLMSLASSTAAGIMRMSRADYLEMCGHFYDKRDMELSELKKTVFQ